MNSVVTNILSDNACRQFHITTKRTQKNMEKLSSGYKINRAADDAAGLSISEKMRNQIRNLNQCVSNAQDGISLIQTADGAMASIDAMLHRGTELSVQAANDTLSEDDRAAIQKEISEIIAEIDTIAEKTRFNNRYLLKGDNADIIGVNNPPTIVGGMPPWGSIDSASAASKQLASNYTMQDGDHAASILDFSAFTGSADDIANAVDTGFYTTCCTCDNHYSIRFNDGTTNSQEQSGSHYIYNIGIGNAKTADDVYQAILTGTNNGHPNGHFTEMLIDNGKLVIYDNRKDTWPSGDYGQMGPGVAHSSADPDGILQGDLYLQLGANAGEDMKLSLPAVSSKKLGISNVTVSDHKKASSAISLFEHAVIYVNQERSKMGAYQNRLEYTINHLENYSENLTNAESSIRDTDIATEITEFSKHNILAQAGQSMIAQANQNQNSLLTLLQS